LLEVPAELLVHTGIFGAKPLRHVEEHLAANREKFCGVFGSIGVEPRLFAGFELLA
jgi:hypothetical protein